MKVADKMKALFLILETHQDKIDEASCAIERGNPDFIYGVVPQLGFYYKDRYDIAELCEHFENLLVFDEIPLGKIRDALSSNGIDLSERIGLHSIGTMMNILGIRNNINEKIENLYALEMCRLYDECIAMDSEMGIVTEEPTGPEEEQPESTQTQVSMDEALEEIAELAEESQ